MAKSKKTKASETVTAVADYEQDAMTADAEEQPTAAVAEPEVDDLIGDLLDDTESEAAKALDQMHDEAVLEPYSGGYDGRVEPIPYGVPLVPGKKVRAKVYSLKLDSIARDSRIQPRSKMDENTIREYAESMKAGDTFPPIVVFREEDQADEQGNAVVYWLADGWHRVYAAEHAEQTAIKAEVYAGGLHDAVLYAAGANATHGLRRTNQDKIRSVEMILSHPTVIEQQWSDNRIAKQAGVSHVTVGTVRRRLNPDDQPVTRLGHDGRVHNVKHRLDARTERAEQPTLYSCGVDDCPHVTAVPSVHCDECGEHYPYAEYDACPSCHPVEQDTGNGHAPVVATLTDEPLEAPDAPLDVPDHGGALPPISEPHAALKALMDALAVVESYAKTIDPTTVAGIVDESATEAILPRLSTHLDWVDGIERSLQARQPVTA